MGLLRVRGKDRKRQAQTASPTRLTMAHGVTRALRVRTPRPRLLGKGAKTKERARAHYMGCRFRAESVLHTRKQTCQVDRAVGDDAYDAMPWCCHLALLAVPPHAPLHLACATRDVKGNNPTARPMKEHDNHTQRKRRHELVKHEINQRSLCYTSVLLWPPWPCFAWRDKH